MSNTLSSTAVSPSTSDLEITLSNVKGVYASCVILDQDRKLSEIHILASTARKPKQIVRDIETLLLAKHRINVDYRKISLVQLADEQLLRMPVARPEIRKVTEQDLGNQKMIRVEIQGGGRTVVGEARDPIGNPSPFHTAAKATVNAIEKLVGRYMDVRLEHSETLRLGSREVLLVLLTCLSEDREETFVGASFVGSRPAESAARATLDALNRRIYMFTAQAPRQAEVEG